MHSVTGLMFSEYLLSGQIPSVKEVNDEEPLLPALLLVNVNPTHKGGSRILSAEAKYAAALIDRRLQLGSKLSEVVTNKEDALALIDLFKDEGYMLAERKGKFCDMLKSVFHVNYLYWLERNAVLEPRPIAEDCKPGGRLRVSLDYVRREFNYVQQDGQLLLLTETDTGNLANSISKKLERVGADDDGDDVKVGAGDDGAL
ncbi:hypothetical protein QJS04_geneDACA023066 [Acorus gramineus]|uniref:Uncharacterized protein n=1 Tax=Acorus gramineus TaxID=55184 RepID=A0AAV8ZXF2_ACOGR|nr:hypothetical protein QJS04_geneDACA023066 [Acorus gramineus]